MQIYTTTFRGRYFSSESLPELVNYFIKNFKLDVMTYYIKSCGVSACEVYDRMEYEPDSFYRMAKNWFEKHLTGDPAVKIDFDITCFST